MALVVRTRLLRQLAITMPESERGATEVVFDAAPTGTQRNESSATLEYGLRVRFAAEHPEADDLLEELIGKHPHPKTLTVVSSDRRIRRKAKARRARVLTAEQFLDWLENPAGRAVPHFADENAQPTAANEELPPPEALPPDEVDYWLRKFGPG